MIEWGEIYEKSLLALLLMYRTECYHHQRTTIKPQLMAIDDTSETNVWKILI